MNLKTLPESERPRERLAEKGAAALSDAELLALLLQNGTRGKNAVQLSQELLERKPLAQLARIPLAQLRKTPGIGLAKAARVSAAFELARRAHKQKTRPRFVKTPEDAARLLVPELRGLAREEFRVLFLNNRGKVLREETVFTGSLEANGVHPREVFARALEEKAAAVVLGHNHPSGDPTPSDADEETTKRFVRAGEALGIRVADHVIVGDKKWTSFAAGNHPKLNAGN